MNNLTYREKFTCEMIWGSIPMTKNWEGIDTDYIRGSKIFQDGLQKFDKGEWMQFEKEIWKDVVGYEGRYLISNIGNVQTLITKSIKYGNKYLKAAINRIGYKTVRLYNSDKKWKIRTIHSIVAEAFIGERPEGMVINHRDSVKVNNRPNNLEYISQKENIRHAYNAGLIPIKKGEKIYNSKLTNIQALEIRELAIKGESIAKIGELYNVSKNVVSNIKRGVSYKL